MEVLCMTQTNNDQLNTSLLKDDFYDAINGGWIENAEIPADHSSTGGFMDLADNIEKILMTDFAKLRDGKMAPENPQMAEFKKFYQMTSNFERRDKAGAAPLKPYLQRIEDLTSYADLNAQLVDWIITGLPLPFDIDVDSDMKNSTIYALFAGGPRLFLPDKTYYEDANEAAKKLMPLFSEMTESLLRMADYPEADAHQIVEQAKDFDRQIAPHVKSAEESADYSKMYNPKDIDTFGKYTDKLDLVAAVKELVNGEPKQIILPEPAYFEALSSLLTDDNFEKIKSWVLVKTVDGLASYLSEDFRQTGSQYGRALSGRKEARSKEKAAYYLASGIYDQVVGDYYGHKYFGEKAKQDVHDMVVKMVNVYKNRLQNNDWLSASTREKAVLKLDKLGIQVGYPDKIDSLYDKFKVTEPADGGTLLGNIMTFTQIQTKDQFSKWNKPVDRTRWEMSANTVNAYYHPFHNIIVFPAAILQAPFYSLEQSSSQNFGGIGAVIAHEISHAFDNNGSLFDEFGNMNNWWTDEDHEHFKGLAENMVNEFEGIPFSGQKVNGRLTVSENIADAGGLSCALEAAKSEDDVDLEAFFINWGTIWRMKATTEYMQLLLSIDVHAPAKLRANVQVQNLDDFFKTFNVTENDQMYKKPVDRVKIW